MTPEALLQGIDMDDLNLAEGQFPVGAVMLLLVSNPDGSSSLHTAAADGLNHWTVRGMLHDALDGERTQGWARGDDT